MARKKKHEEHENLERWLVSYADFMTLLFATFVVLYALSQIDISSFMKIEDSLRKAFSSSIISGSQSIMPEQGSAVMSAGAADSMLDTILMEYISPKYEDKSFEEIKADIEKLKNNELKDVTVEITKDGLYIRLDNSDLAFESASAKLKPAAIKKLDIIGALISQKFMMHQIKITGHTDSLPVFSPIFPSNWELSSSRACAIVRYFTQRFKFLPNLFVPIGLADTSPIASNSTEQGRKKNRRTEILILRNRKAQNNLAQKTIMQMTKQQQKSLREEQLEAVNQILSVSVNKNQQQSHKIELFTETQKAFDINVIDENLYQNENRRLNEIDPKPIKLRSRK